MSQRYDEQFDTPDPYENRFDEARQDTPEMECLAFSYDILRWALASIAENPNDAANVARAALERSADAMNGIWPKPRS